MAYDEIGNPLYIGYTSDGEIFDSAYELIWEGRQLVTHRYREYYYEDDIEYFDEVNYTYNADGIRTSKTVEGIKHEYILNGSQIIAETWTERGVEYVLFYFYDEAGAPLGIKYRTSNYAANDYDYFYFEKNLQGDIVAVYNESGVKIGLYYYDAWGNFTTYSFGSTGLERYIVEDYNPFRYRGYYYDIETGYYYLQSRYYNPNWGRFLNADGHINGNRDIIGFNMFAYCSNNPIMGYDPTGEWNWGSFLMAVATVAVVTATVALAVATVGTVMGVAAPVVTAAVKLTVAGGIVEGSKEIINQLAEDGEVTDTGAVATETRDGGLGGFVDCMTGNASKFVADSIGFLVSVSMSGADSYNGRTFESFMKGASTEAQDELLLSTISWALDTLLVPGATEKMVDALEIILPGRR